MIPMKESLLSQLASFQFSNLLDTRLMASPVKWCLQPEFHDFDCKFWGDDPGTNSQDVCIVV